jgi:ABC-type sugar transport system permease subunit
VVAAIALCTFWGFVYNQRFGLVNGFLKVVGLERLIQPWTDSSHLLGAELVALIWIYTGYFLVILLAGADKIPTEIYDAARVDGANPFQMFIQVTIPLMWDVIGVALILWMITALKQFEFIYAFGGAALNISTYTMPIYLYVEGFGKRDPIYRLGYSSAIGITLLALVVIFAIIMRRFLKRETVQF